MAIMHLSKENFTCPKQLISLYLSLLKQLTLSKTVRNQIYSVDSDWLVSLVNSIDPDQCNM